MEVYTIRLFCLLKISCSREVRHFNLVTELSLGGSAHREILHRGLDRSESGNYGPEAFGGLGNIDWALSDKPNEAEKTIAGIFLEIGRTRTELYQRSWPMIYMRPLSHADRCDRLGLSKEFVPSVAGGVDDFLEVLEDPVGKPVGSQIMPDVLDRVQFGGA